MAHFSKLDNNNVVIQVVTVSNEVITDENGVEQEQLGVDFLNDLYKTSDNWKQTSYNFNFRKNFGGIGTTYDSDKDAFIPQKPFEGWTLNNSTCKWEAPIPYPDDGERYVWLEEVYLADNTKGWELL